MQFTEEPIKPLDEFLRLEEYGAEGFQYSDEAKTTNKEPINSLISRAFNKKVF